ncbi:hypothetical protein GCM10029976_074330 [Kribbella albertanoniae]
MRQILPVADGAEIRRHARRIALQHPRALLIALGLHALAAVSGLAAPRLIGDLVQDVQNGTTAAKVNLVIGLIAGFVVVQSLLTRWARYRSFALGEQVLAELREDFVDNALALPIGTVERAGPGICCHAPRGTSTRCPGLCASPYRRRSSRSSPCCSP